MDHSYQDQQQTAPYTEFFSWGSDSYGQLALANSDDDDRSSQLQQRHAFYDQPKSLSFDILISQIACGDYHAAFISGDGFVFSVGRNTEGQLGVGDTSLMQSSAPLLIDALPKQQPKMLKCGGSHTALLYDNGDLYTWGQGQYGALGHSTSQNVFSPVQVQVNADRHCVKVSIDCGKRNTAVIDLQGRIYFTGDNSYRQLGLGKEQVNQFTQLADFTEKAKSVALGLDYTLILTQDDKVFASGNNKNGNLGLGHVYSSDNFLQVHGLLGQKVSQIEAGRHAAAITGDGKLHVWGPVFKGESTLLLPQELRSSKVMKQIAVGEKDSILIDQDNQLYSWGLSQSQQSNANAMPTLIDSLATKIITQVAVGLDYFIALGQDFNENGDPIETQKQSHSDYKTSSHNDYKIETAYQRQDYQDKSYSPYQGSKNYTSDIYGSKDNLNKSHNDIGKPPVPQEHSVKRDASMISSHSNRSRDPTFQYSHIQPDQEKAYNGPPSASASDKYKPLVSPSSEGRFTNADLYRQLDVSKEENHQLKQKNRELQHKLNQLKTENENIITNADSEIKRMSEFIDQYTQEVEATKKEFEDDMQQKLDQEKRMNEDLRRKIHQDQSDLNVKLDNLQREIEKLKKENVQLHQDKTDQQLKNRQLVEQLDQLQIKQSLIQREQPPRDYATISPMSQAKQDRYQPHNQHYSRTPNNLHSQHQVHEFPTQSRTQEFQQREQIRSQEVSNLANGSSVRESQTPVLNAQRRRGVSPADFSPIPSAYDQQHQTLDQSRLPQSYPRHREHETSDRKPHIKSPVRDTIDYQAYPKSNTDYSYAEDYQRSNMKPYSDSHLYEDQKQSFQGRDQYPKKSPHRQYDQYEQQNQNSDRKVYNYKREEPVAAKESPALNDVKNRLAAMQKNKEELEEKLRTYEAKIRQHFNR